jgi:hypothetical protein
MSRSIREPYSLGAAQGLLVPECIFVSYVGSVGLALTRVPSWGEEAREGAPGGSSPSDCDSRSCQPRTSTSSQ